MNALRKSIIKQIEKICWFHNHFRELWLVIYFLAINRLADYCFFIIKTYTFNRCKRDKLKKRDVLLNGDFRKFL